jgi:hypothetical protein
MRRRKRDPLVGSQACVHMVEDSPFRITWIHKKRVKNDHVHATCSDKMVTQVVVG